MSPVNIFSNDPNARGLELVQVEIPAEASHFIVAGWNGAGGLFQPGTPEFQAGLVSVVLGRTYGAWKDFSGGDFLWQSGVPQLHANPRAGRDLNAYYDRSGLKFFFDKDKVTGKPIFTSESSDVVAHECGHAILDAHHPEFWDSLLSETAAFHEAFGDIMALLVTLNDPVVRAAMLAENEGDLGKSNVVSRLAEQLAHGIYDLGKADAVASADALRDLTVRFRYRDPDKLPASTPASELSSESHNFSRIFSGAFYDVLVGIYIKLRKSNEKLSADDALVQARNDAGRLLSKALLIMPKGDAPFKVVASSMLTANAQDFAGDYFGVLRRVFVGRDLMTVREADAFKPRTARHIVVSALSGVASGAVSTVINAVDWSRRIGDDLPSGYRRPLGIGKQEFRLIDQKSDDAVVLHYAAEREMQLDGADLGEAQGAMISLTDTLSVHVDPEGNILSSQLHKTDEGYANRIRDHVAKLIERGRVYASAIGEKIDPSNLIEQKKPYYIDYDEAGNKRIRRAFIACGDK
jgi:hypothetical protein